MIDYSLDDRGLAVITLNRPDAGNALDQDTADGLEAAARAATTDPSTRAVVLQGSGKVFCAGGDVVGMSNAAERDLFLAELAGAAHRALTVLHDSPVPIVAAVHGAAAGAGLGLVLAADLVVATEMSSYVTAYSSVGLSPDCGVSIWLPRVIGFRRAMRMLLNNEKIDAATALDWGLVDSVVDQDSLNGAVDCVVDEILAGPYPALGASRQLVRASYEHTFGEHLDAEAESIARAGSSEDAARSLARFARR